MHNLATDSEGNLYTAEVDTGKRAQKFELTDAKLAPKGGGDGNGWAESRDGDE